MDEKKRAELLVRKANLELALMLLEERFQISSRIYAIGGECGIEHHNRERPDALKKAIRDIDKQLDYDSWVATMAKIRAGREPCGNDDDALTVICQRYLADRKIPMDKPQ